jgi:hypothetical protein
MSLAYEVFTLPFKITWLILRVACAFALYAIVALLFWVAYYQITQPDVCSAVRDVVWEHSVTLVRQMHNMTTFLHDNLEKGASMFT